MKTNTISWNQLNKQITKLTEIITESDFKPDCIIGIACGGLIPATILAKKLKIKKLYCINASSYKNKQKGVVKITNSPKLNSKIRNILLVDEIADSGDTLKEIKQKIKRSSTNIKSATLFVNKNRCSMYPDYFLKETTAWITFPWE